MEDRSGLTAHQRLAQHTDQANEAFQAGRLNRALYHYEQAVRALTLDLDHLAPAAYENLALARMNAGRLPSAIRAFNRALDGDPSSREQSLRFLVACQLRAGRHQDAAASLARYEEHFGPHPEPWVRERFGRE